MRIKWNLPEAIITLSVVGVAGIIAGCVMLALRLGIVEEEPRGIHPSKWDRPPEPHHTPPAPEVVHPDDRDRRHFRH